MKNKFHKKKILTKSIGGLLITDHREEIKIKVVIIIIITRNLIRHEDE